MCDGLVRKQRGVWWLIASVLALANTASAQFQNDQLRVKATEGRVVYSVDHVTWHSLEPGMALGSGAVLRTEAGSTVDVILKNCRTALRLAPDSELELAKLCAVVIGDEVIADTVLNLKAGSLIGSQRKLAKLSRFDILFPGGAVNIHGTEYEVKANGTVACITGEVSVRSSSSQAAAPVNVLVPAGSALDSATGQVGPTSPQLLASVQPDINAVRETAKSLASPLMAVADKSNGNMSPNHGEGNGNGNGNDHDNGNGGGNGNGNANGNGNGDGDGPGTGNGQN
jgi:TrAA12-like/FecR protein